MTIVLASSSPRRIDYLIRLGIVFTAVAPDVDETIPPGTDPAAAVETLASAKATAVRPSNPDATIVAADTVVVIDGDMLGKPADAPTARSMLQRLQNRTHQVFTGLVMIRPDGHRTIEVVETLVTMRSLKPDQIDAYIATGEPMDKAGAYGIQGHGAALVGSINGCYSSVAGLPICRLTDFLTDSGHYDGDGITCGEGLDRPPASIEQRFPLR
jgi:septum formation protein